MTPNLSAGASENGLRNGEVATVAPSLCDAIPRIKAAANPANIIAVNAGIPAIARVGLTTATISSIRGNSIELVISALRAAGIAVSGASATAREIPIVYALLPANAPAT